METLSTYPTKKNLRVFFSNMPNKKNSKEIYEYFSLKVPNILNVICTVKDKRRTGQGYFVLKSEDDAEKLIKFEGQRVDGREISYIVEKLE